MIYKGTIASMDSEVKKARIIPDGSSEKTVPNVVIPSGLRSRILKGTRVLFAYFPDGEGIVISRMDGENNG